MTDDGHPIMFGPRLLDRHAFEPPAGYRSAWHVRIPPSCCRFDLLDDVDPHARRVHDAEPPLTPRLVGQGQGDRHTCLDQAGVLARRVIDLQRQERSIALVRPAVMAALTDGRAAERQRQRALARMRHRTNQEASKATSNPNHVA